MSKKTYLITGANGEIGHALILYLKSTFPDAEIISSDIKPLDPELAKLVTKDYQADIQDGKLIDAMFSEYDIQTVFHLASILSTKAEKNPELGHNINVNGSVNILHSAAVKSEKTGIPVKVIFPSSCAVYGLPDLETKKKAGACKEYKYLSPITMYGCNKLYVERLGDYFSKHYHLVEVLETETKPRTYLDFRCIRFPGLISAITVPCGGTSDYGPEMLHMAAQGKPYSCFVRPDSVLPFMTMKDAIKSLIMLEAAEKSRLTQLVYNVASYQCTAEDFYNTIHGIFPKSKITFEPTPSRQKIVDSWPENLDDSAARKDWGWKPDYDYEQSFSNYLTPAVKQKYGITD